MRNLELELYKLIINPEDDEDINYVEELGWINDSEFCVWVSYMWITEFIDKLRDIFGYEIFDDGGFNGNMQSNCICIDMCKAVGYIINIEDIFSKEKYKH